MSSYSHDIASESRYAQILKADLPTFLEDVFKDDRSNPFATLRQHQATTLRLAHHRLETIVAAPSQSGKSTGNLGFLVPLLFKPGSTGIYITNSLVNVKEMYSRFVISILGDPEVTAQLQKIGVKDVRRRGLGIKALTTIGRRTTDQYIEIAATGVRFYFLPATPDAIAGKSPDRLILDEPPLYGELTQRHVYGEALARMGDTRGQMLETSTVRKPGDFAVLPNGEKSYSGCMFYGRLREFTEEQSLNPSPYRAALDFTYHCSENLRQSVPKMSMATQQKKHHYWGIPMESDLMPIFDRFGEDNICEDLNWDTTLHYPSDRWALSCDPGNTSAFVLMQLKQFPTPKIIVHLTWQTLKGEKFWDTCRRVSMDTARYMQDNVYKLALHADVASKHKHGNSANTYLQTLQSEFGKYPTVRMQGRASGVNLMKLYLDKPMAFMVARNNASHLVSAMKKAIPEVDKETGSVLDTYVKDGVNDHILDATRYAISNETHGRIPEAQSFNKPIQAVRSIYG